MVMPVVVVGDQKSSSKFLVSPEAKFPVEFLSLARQKELYPDLDLILPKNHFARKNMGYLLALEMGACHVWDFDDDNYLTGSSSALNSSITYKRNETCDPDDAALF
jgi:hypothetical protein